MEFCERRPTSSPPAPSGRRDRYAPRLIFCNPLTRLYRKPGVSAGDPATQPGVLICVSERVGSPAAPGRRCLPPKIDRGCRNPCQPHSRRSRRAVWPRRLSAHHRQRWSAHELCVGRSQGQRHCVRYWEVCRQEHCQQAQRVAVLAAKGAGRLRSRRQWHSYRTARAERLDQSGDYTDQISPSSRGPEASRQRWAMPIRLPAHRKANINTRSTAWFTVLL